MHDGKIRTETRFIRLDKPNLMQILTYKAQYQVISTEDGPFGTVCDAGAAVYLIEKDNLLSCVGIISRTLPNDDGVLVTPIQDILHTLEGQLGQTLEVVGINPHLTKV